MAKKLLATLLATFLIIGVAACGRSNDTTSGDAGTTMIVRYNDPTGYELYGSGDNTAEYVIMDDDGEITHSIGLVIQAADDEMKAALQGNSVETLEDAMNREFADGLTPNFITVGDYKGVRFDQADDSGAIVAKTYMMSVGNWRVSILTNEEYPDTIDEMDAAIQEIIESIHLEKFSLGG